MASSPLVVLMVVSLVVGAVALLPRRDVRHPVVALVRVLLPSWRFFDDVQESAALMVRVGRAGEDFGPWQAPLAAPPRRLSHLLWNPAGNLLLAQHALLEQLLSDVSDWDERRTPGPDALVSYQLVLNLVRTLVAADESPGAGGRVQFRLVEAAAPGADAVLLISREHPAA